MICYLSIRKFTSSMVFNISFILLAYFYHKILLFKTSWPWNIGNHKSDRLVISFTYALGLETLHPKQTLTNTSGQNKCRGSRVEMASLPLDSELETRIKKGTEKISENMHIVANEPSLAFYRLQEHVRKSLPPMVEKRVEVLHLNQDLQGCLYDVEYGVSAVKSIEKAQTSFSNMKDLMKSALAFKQQLKQEEMKRNKKELTSSSVYRRLSAHISLDHTRSARTVGNTT